jgi:lipoteichoic acid synthase
MVTFGTRYGEYNRGWRSWSVEAGPAALLLASLFVKFVYASLSLEQPIPLARSVVSAMFASLLILGAPLTWAGRTWRFIIVLVFDAFLTVLLMSDRIHHRFFGDILSVAELPHAWQIGAVTSGIFDKMQIADALFYVDVLIALAALPFYIRLCRGLPQIDLHGRILTGFSLIVLGLLVSIPTILLVYQDRDSVFSWRAARRQIVGAIGFLPYHVLDFAIYVQTYWDSIHVTEPQRERVRVFLNERRRVSQNTSPLYGTAHGLNLIVLQAESLQAFPIGRQIGGQFITPNLNAFAAESMRFINFYDQTYEGATSDAEFASLQSLHPIETGAISTRYLANRYRGLPAVLSERGYTTFAAIGQPGEYWNMRGMHSRLGFQRSYFDDSFPTGERFGQGLADRDFLMQTLPMLAAQAEPFMAFLVTLSNHDPYDLPEKYRTLKLGPLDGTRVGKYLQSVHYFDDAFGEFMARLRKTGLLDKSLVVVYGDHQAWLEEPRELAWLLGFPAESKYDHWKVRKKLPLFIRLPHAKYSGAETVTGGHLDISPTILSLLGVTIDPIAMMGADLTQGTDSLVVFRDGSFVDGRYYFINAFEIESYPVCYEVNGDRKVSCASLEARRREAMERLEISDLIIRGDLVPTLSTHGNELPRDG